MWLFKALQVYCDDTSRSAAMNMAVDEALLELAEHPSLRFYRWDHRALSFGYFGKYEDVTRYKAERDMVRRWTGGGIVFHGNDLTYAIVVPNRDPIYAQSSVTVYESVHRAVRDVFAANGQQSELAAVAGDAGTAVNSESIRSGYNKNTCFTRPVRADVLVNGQKVAGAAQRRARIGLLQQGSIQNIDLPEDFAERFAHALSATRQKCRIDEPILTRARQIAREKYDSESWLRRR